MTSLNDRHEGSIDPGIFGTQPAFDVGTDGAGHAVEHLVAIAGHFLLDAIVEAGPPAEREGRGQADIVIDRPGIAPIGHHCAEPCAVETEAVSTSRVRPWPRVLARPFAPDPFPGPPRNAGPGNQTGLL